MAYEYLKNLFGTNDDGTPKSITADELEKLITDSGLQIVDLAAGSHVAKSDLDAKLLELSGVQDQLKAANDTIKSYKDMDIDGIKQSAADWEKKYKDDTAALQEKLADQARDFATERYLDGFSFSSNAARKQAKADFMAQELKRDEAGRFIGADEFMKRYKESDPGAFAADPTPTPAPAPGGKKPQFAPEKPASPPGGKVKKLSLMEMMKRKNENPDISVDSMFSE